MSLEGIEKEDSFIIYTDKTYRTAALNFLNKHEKAIVDHFYSKGKVPISTSAGVDGWILRDFYGMRTFCKQYYFNYEYGISMDKAVQLIKDMKSFLSSDDDDNRLYCDEVIPDSVVCGGLLEELKSECVAESYFYRASGNTKCVFSYRDGDTDVYDVIHDLPILCQMLYENEDDIISLLKIEGSTITTPICVDYPGYVRACVVMRLYSPTSRITCRRGIQFVFVTMDGVKTALR